ncbi:hypothetical protein COW36_14830 [bacterium (Candidatus Blackallbacteria) CG17_big_fil_post_rev_8_21_14_2_50_48_46]|uniref:Uncharacterized protein n=1 Tax=bacterium (Candidatus Blackallbacteria) CG17_big_fil_post_rev_8_21_14_2_50_48_46 TaxID=2014261 RepID=A0A2M7G2E6_9BACT|nr:MAG: hypothetical protein COW64_11720 [bacterium (Candidatus Blackallbacteria) CG18_big_fil_WC_8_21_14_2_50_49_26]PIW15987.1 MAG: hypothetical protein COW36_14830 [bacterium (Candidatus Blackallbacteria) CG17_big_fil_post_rev_8_21_14_2_50_48_46]PIW50399.1 MAG: hypothetical protein COW20_02545 [bacterium (Candidatus Blackallbacteria) CG13_big_fil_rev_8_21_14_2_50_49_14]
MGIFRCCNQPSRALKGQRRALLLGLILGLCWAHPVQAELEPISPELETLRTEPWKPWTLGVEFQSGYPLNFSFGLVGILLENWQWGFGLTVAELFGAQFYFSHRYYLPPFLLSERFAYSRLYFELQHTLFDFGNRGILFSQVGLDTRLGGNSILLSAGVVQDNFTHPGEWTWTPRIQMGIGFHQLQPLSERYEQLASEKTKLSRNLQLSVVLDPFQEYDQPNIPQNWMLGWMEPQWGVGAFLRTNSNVTYGAGLAGRYYLYPRQLGFNLYTETSGYTGVARIGETSSAPPFSPYVSLRSGLGLEWQIMSEFSLDFGLGLGVSISQEKQGNVSYLSCFSDQHLCLFTWPSLSIHFNLPTSNLAAPVKPAPNPDTQQQAPTQFESQSPPVSLFKIGFEQGHQYD